MVFSSHLFVFYFLPLALAFYYLLPRRAKLAGLAAVSYLFYGWANPAFVLVMLTSTLIDYVCARVLGSVGSARGRADARVRRVAVTVSVVSNLGLLGFFKYFNFAVESLAPALAWLGLPAAWGETALHVTLPLGISFYTFQSMSYTLDVYRGRHPPLTSFIDLAAYVSMFPQLVAGPIVRFSEVRDQLLDRVHSVEKLARGAALLCLGLAKKILLANPCGLIADAAFDAGSVGSLDAWYGVVAYSFQIYFDFSGYSDMAIGLGLMLGFTFPKNFDSPYRARSITEFWRRWHISLSTWLRDYLYIPLGGNRRGPSRTYVNLMLVMLLGGLWHGAAWSFLAWGGVHGLLLAAERAAGRRALYHRFPEALRTALTFLIVTASWTFFRADDLSHAGRYLAALAGLSGLAGAGGVSAGADLLAGVLYSPYLVLSFLSAALVTWGLPQSWDWTRKIDPGRAVLILILFVAALVAMETQGYNPFIYFIF